MGSSSDLHVSNVTAFHQGFPRLQLSPVQIIIFRVLGHLLHSTPRGKPLQVGGCSPLLSLSHMAAPCQLVSMPDSSVRVSRRARQRATMPTASRSTFSIAHRRNILGKQSPGFPPEALQGPQPETATDTRVVTRAHPTPRRRELWRARLFVSLQPMKLHVFSPPPQGSLHLSFAVLVCYRSLFRI